MPTFKPGMRRVGHTFVWTVCLTAVLGVGGPGLAQPLVLAQADAVEIEFWQSVKDSSNPLELEAYLKSFPGGRFAGLAKLRLNKLSGDPGAAASTAEVSDESVTQDADEFLSLLNGHEYLPDDRAFLGAEIEYIKQDTFDRLRLEDYQGIRIVSALAGFPADGALFSDDIVLFVDGKRVRDPSHFVELVTAHNPGDEVNLSVLRGGDQRIVTVRTTGSISSALHSAAKGHTGGLLAVGHVFARGAATIERDNEKAFGYYQRAADAGDMEALYYVAKHYHFGRGVMKDDEKARELMGDAADLGHGRSQAELAYYLYTGVGGETDYAAAQRYARAAANQQVGRGYYVLGLVAATDTELGPADQDLAAKFYRDAARLGSAGGKRNLEALKLPIYTDLDIQRYLAELGLYTGTLDGRIGPQSRRAIRAFQRLAGWEETGKASAELAARLYVTVQSSKAPSAEASTVPNTAKEGDRTDWSNLDSLD